MPGGPAIVIGKYKLREATTFTSLYECAAWSQDILVQPGEYVVRGNFDSLGLYWAHVGFPGIITRAHFPAVFGGVQYGNAHDQDHIGEEGKYVMGGVYGYSIAKAIAQDPYGTPWKLDPGFLVVPAGYDNTSHVYRTDGSWFEIKTPAYHVVKE